LAAKERDKNTRIIISTLNEEQKRINVLGLIILAAVVSEESSL
jgi:hypothetical protein